jgi:hypothetical protein
VKRWYRVTLDLAYEGDILDRDGRVVTDKKQAKEILERVVSLDIGGALRKTTAGPVDWTVISAEPKP